MIFKNKELKEKFNNILLNKGFGLKKYGFKRVGFEKIINSEGNIQYKTSLKLLDVYNDFYGINSKISNIFNINKLLNYKYERKKVEYKIIDDGGKSFDSIIDFVLSFMKILTFPIYIIFLLIIKILLGKEDNKNGIILGNDKNINLFIIFNIIFISFILFTKWL